MLFKVSRLLQSTARDLINDLDARDPALAHTRDRILARDINRAPGRDLELDPDINRALGVALARDRALGVAYAHDRARAHAFVGPLLSLAHTRDRALDLARYRARDLDLGPDNNRDLDLARALARDVARDLDLARDFDRALDHLAVNIINSAIIQEAFFPELSSSWPPFECDSLDGHIGDATLAGPGLVVFDLEQNERMVHFTDPVGKRPEPLVRRGYDLTFPMTAIPLGNLRRTCSAWRTDRCYPPLGVAPFLFPGLYSVWSKHAKSLRKAFQVPQIFALLPRIELWSKPFADWTEEDWSTCGLSALWELDSGRVLWAHGAHDVTAMPTVSRTALEFFGAPA